MTSLPRLVPCTSQYCAVVLQLHDIKQTDSSLIILPGIASSFVPWQWLLSHSGCSRSKGAFLISKWWNRFVWFSITFFRTYPLDLNIRHLAAQPCYLRFKKKIPLIIMCSVHTWCTAPQRFNIPNTVIDGKSRSLDRLQTLMGYKLGRDPLVLKM